MSRLVSYKQMLFLLQRYMLFQMSNDHADARLGSYEAGVYIYI
jgi:hypothetical protein